jgi:hypothetical protein
MTIRDCEACGAPIFDAEPDDLLCDLCSKVIDTQTDLLLEMRFFDPGPDCE